MVRVSLNDFVDRLRGEEAYKPKDQRRPIPTQREIANALGVGFVTMNRIANLSSDDTSPRKNISLEQLDMLLKFFHERGFPVEISDLLVYEPD